MVTQRRTKRTGERIMTLINIYTEQNAKRDYRARTPNGLSLSIKKWETIVSALWKIYTEMLNPCGLCIQHEDCSGCPLKSCSSEPYQYTNAHQEIENGIASADTFLKQLKELKTL